MPTSYTDGKVHIVEFWATWCAPCRESIPHLSELARKYAGRVDVTGVSVWEHKHSGNGASDPLPTVQDFVRRQGKQMAYNVGADTAGRAR